MVNTGVRWGKIERPVLVEGICSVQLDRRYGMRLRKGDDEDVGLGRKSGFGYGWAQNG